MIEPSPISVEAAIARIAQVCTLLDADPDSFLFAEVGEADAPAAETTVLDTAAALLAVGGMRCGNIFLSDKPYPADAPVYDRVDGGAERFMVIGEIDGVPFLADRTDGTIWHQVRATAESYETPPQRIAPDLWTFVAWSVLGPGYPDIAAEDTREDNNPWLAFLQHNGLMDVGSTDQEPLPAVSYDEIRLAWGARGLLRFPAERYPEAPGLSPDLLPPAVLYPQQVPVLLKTTGLPEQTPLNTVIEWPYENGAIDLVVIGAPETAPNLVYCLAPGSGAVYLANLARLSIEAINSSFRDFVGFLYRFTAVMAETAEFKPGDRQRTLQALHARLAATDPAAFDQAQGWWSMVFTQAGADPTPRP